MTTSSKNPDPQSPLKNPEARGWPDYIHILDTQSPVPDGKSPKHCIGIAHETSMKSLLQIALSTDIHHIVQSSSPDFETEVEVAASLIQSPQLFFSDPISTILSIPVNLDLSKGAENFLFQFQSSREKVEMLNALQNYISLIKRSATVRDSIRAIADELFTNAIYDAPTGDGKTSRQDPSKNGSEDNPHEKEVATIFASFTSDRFVIGCSDAYGSLTIDRALARVLRCYTQGISTAMNMGTGGAGIGLQMIFDLCTSVFIGVQRFRKTMICCVLPLGKSFREIETMSKNLHIINVE